MIAARWYEGRWSGGIEGEVSVRAALVRNVFSIAVMVLALASATAAAISFHVYPPGSTPEGQTYNEHAADWWRWALAQTADTSAILDETGANCATGQSGDVWYLAGSFSGQPVVRSCTVPFGSTLVFPVLNAAYFAFPSDPKKKRTEAYVRAQVADMIEASDLELEIDGVSVPNVASFFEQSVLFAATLPANNIFGLPAGTVLSPAADAGYYVAIDHLNPGEHTIHFHGQAPDGFIVDVTYELTVQAAPN